MSPHLTVVVLWVIGALVGLVRSIGTAEVLGAIGLFVLGGLAAFVAWGRSGKGAIAPR